MYPVTPRLQPSEAANSAEDCPAWALWAAHSTRPISSASWTWALSKSRYSAGVGVWSAVADNLAARATASAPASALGSVWVTRVEARRYYKPGQFAVDPNDSRVTENQFESSARLEVYRPGKAAQGGAGGK